MNDARIRVRVWYSAAGGSLLNRKSSLRGVRQSPDDAAISLGPSAMSLFRPSLHILCRFRYTRLAIESAPVTKKEMINDDAARTTRTKQQVMRKIEARETPRRSVIWKTVCVLSLVISSLAPSSFAQIGGSIPLIKYAQRESRKDIYYESDTYFSDRYYELWSFTDALEFLEEYRGIEAGTILPIRISTWSIPVTLVRLHSDDFGFTRIVPTLSVGIGYVWISGTSIIDAKSESIRIEPQTALGFATSFGAVNGITGIEGSITVSGIIGFRSMFMSLGYDILTDTGVLGVGIRVDVFGLSSNSYEISRLSN